MLRPLLSLFLPMLGLCALTGCTGKEDDPPAVRLVIQDSGNAVVADPNGNDANNFTPRANVVISGGVVGVATLAGVNRVAIAFQDHVSVYQTTDSVDGAASADLGLQEISRLTLPQRTDGTAFTSPCFTKMTEDNTRTLLVLLSDPSGCAGQTGQSLTQREVVLNTSSTDPTLSWWRDLPSPQATPAQTLIAVNGTTMLAVRPNPSSGSDLLRATISDGQTALTLANRAGPLPSVYSLTNYKGVVYAATADPSQGVRSVGNAELGAVLLTPPSTLLFADGDYLASYGSPNSLIFVNGSLNNAATPLSVFAAPGGMAAPPDGYAYVLQGASLYRYDVQVGLANANSTNASFMPTGLSLLGSSGTSVLVNPQGIAWAVPQASP